MEKIYIAVGILFIVAISLFVIAFSVFQLVQIWKGRKDSEFKDYMLSQLMSIDRYCCCEFPQVALLARDLKDGIVDNWRRLDAGDFRDKLRKNLKVE